MGNITFVHTIHMSNKSGKTLKRLKCIYKLIAISSSLSFKVIKIIHILVIVKFSQTPRRINMRQNGGGTPHILHRNASPRAGYTA